LRFEFHYFGVDRAAQRAPQRVQVHDGSLGNTHVGVNRRQRRRTADTKRLVPLPNRADTSSAPRR
jgi:hypothetical protein